MPSAVSKDYLKDFNLFPTMKMHESIIYLGGTRIDNKTTMCFGVGSVVKIEKGKNYDLVVMNFGRKINRKIFVKLPMARKQIVGLKKGEYSWFYGFRKMYFSKADKDHQRKVETCFFARAFQPWYVPKAFDVKFDPNEIESMTSDTEKEIKFIDNLVKKGF